MSLPPALPVLLNPTAGSAAAVRRALAEDARFAVREVAPGEVAAEVRRAASAGARRVVVAGGDGTVGAAAAAAMEEGVELAVLPGGTLNHFARNLGIPTGVPEALELARSGAARPVGAAAVNGRLFLNTSSLGAYVRFVRTRERLEPALGRRLATLAAAAGTFCRRPRLRLVLEAGGEVHGFRTPLLFVGVGERSLAPLGAPPAAEARPGLLVLVVHSSRIARLVVRGLAALRGGVEEVERLPEVSAFRVDRCVVRLAAPRARLAADGELLSLPTPLEYRALPGALRVVVP